MVGNGRDTATRPVAVGPRAYVVTVSLAADDRGADLLTIASVLHRRGVRVVEADLARPADGLRTFSATIVTDAMRAATVVRTLQNRIDVLDADLFEALDTRVRIAS
ncbi:hypothetical protein [Aeromicrobium chenweiae]|uniref:Uncharacterized protein n=1 Tax=Aeromicrobium chenweiae TaxID=2079793 RepID=A0A2S0WJS4_9ACTN|nr:hypothetical protein [Aeromicrobium chenweiae]AWB91524.1 hypothetical protein C3E78_04420 [Aeromicrobium chenweiae]TGN32359.1 hypothetical protein E4L97_06385 [Aeromicrobium chenweiae]